MEIEEATEILNNHLLCLSGKMISKPKQKDLIKALSIALNQISQLISANKDIKKNCENCKTNIANRGLGKTKVLCSSCWNLLFK